VQHIARRLSGCLAHPSLAHGTCPVRHRHSHYIHAPVKRTEPKNRTGSAPSHGTSGSDPTGSFAVERTRGFGSDGSSANQRNFGFGSVPHGSSGACAIHRSETHTQLGSAEESPQNTRALHHSANGAHFFSALLRSLGGLRRKRPGGALVGGTRLPQPRACRPITQLLGYYSE